MEIRNIGKSEKRKFRKSESQKERVSSTLELWNPEVQKFSIWKFGKSEIWKFETSENRGIGKTEIQEIGKSERKGFLKNKRITAMSVSCFFTNTSGFPGLLATFILTDGWWMGDGWMGDGWVMGRTFIFLFYLFLENYLIYHANYFWSS